MGVGIVGGGAVGARAARWLTVYGPSPVLVADPSASARSALRRAVGRSVTVTDELRDLGRLETVVLAGPTGTHEELARKALAAGCSVVSVGDDVDEVRDLLDLDELARHHQRCLVVGAGFGPGLSCLLARVAARWFDVVDEVHVAKLGTGGPACARQHHRALASSGHDWRNGEFVRRPGGSGRELLWFPNPVDGHDCYRGALPDAFLLQRWFPSADRITARVAATRRDRLTMGLPMLRRPHPEGLIGAVRVEVRGRSGSQWRSEIVGCAERTAVAAGAVCAVAAAAAARGELAPGAYGLAGVPDPAMLLRRLLGEGGLRVHRFVGAADAT